MFFAPQNHPKENGILFIFIDENTKKKFILLNKTESHIKALSDKTDNKMGVINAYYKSYGTVMVEKNDIINLTKNKEFNAFNTKDENGKLVEYSETLNYSVWSNKMLKDSIGNIYRISIVTSKVSKNYLDTILQKIELLKDYMIEYKDNGNVINEKFDTSKNNCLILMDLTYFINLGKALREKYNEGIKNIDVKPVVFSSAEYIISKDIKSPPKTSTMLPKVPVQVPFGVAQQELGQPQVQHLAPQAQVQHLGPQAHVQHPFGVAPQAQIQHFAPQAPAPKKLAPAPKKLAPAPKKIAPKGPAQSLASTPKKISDYLPASGQPLPAKSELTTAQRKELGKLLLEEQASERAARAAAARALHQDPVFLKKLEDIKVNGGSLTLKTISNDNVSKYSTPLKLLCLDNETFDILCNL